MVNGSCTLNPKLQPANPKHPKPPHKQILWVVDSADPTRFEEAKETLARVTDDLQLEGIPLMLLANKR